MIELSDKAAQLLMSARCGDQLDWPELLIERTLGYETWRTNGEKGRRKDVAELYRHGLIAEMHSPWSRPCYLTEKGEKALCDLYAKA